MIRDTVCLDELVTLGSAYKDHVFEEYVTSWFDRNMSYIPMGLLDCDDYEKWELHESSHLTVEAITAYLYDPEDDPDHEEEDEEVFLLWDEAAKVYLSESDYQGDVASDGTLDRNGVCVPYWIWESEAEEAAQSHHDSENSCTGFPWASGTGYLPDSRISDAVLQAAGFTVATYAGPQGDYRLCGIDGGGYSFALTHHVRLAVDQHLEKDWTMATVTGDKKVVWESKGQLEQLAEAIEEMADVSDAR